MCFVSFPVTSECGSASALNGASSQLLVPKATHADHMQLDNYDAVQVLYSQTKLETPTGCTRSSSRANTVSQTYREFHEPVEKAPHVLAYSLRNKLACVLKATLIFRWGRMP